MSPTSKNISDQAGAQIERVKIDLLSLVSHELRTPLTSVLNALHILKEERDLGAAEREKFLDMASRNAEKLKAVLGQLLDLSKLVSGRLVCRFHEVPLKTLLITELERLENEAESAKYKLVFEGVRECIDKLPTILGDATRLEQAVRGLFDNALKFSPAGATITVMLKANVKKEELGPSRYVVLEVSNPAKRGSFKQGTDCLQIFSQQEGILDRMHEGVGGSLAIAAEVLRQHDGILQAGFFEDGDRFKVTMALPVLENEAALLKVLESRMYALKTEVGALSLLILEVGEKSLKIVSEALKAALFRASDTVYGLSGAGQIAVVMDDCKKSDAPKIVRRLLAEMSPEVVKFLKETQPQAARVGLASSPEDATDPEKLLAMARAAFVPIGEL